MTPEMEAAATSVKTPVGSSQSTSVNGDDAPVDNSHTSINGSVKDDNSHGSIIARSVTSARTDRSDRSSENGDQRNMESRASDATMEMEIHDDVVSLKNELDKITVDSPTMKV